MARREEMEAGRLVRGPLQWSRHEVINMPQIGWWQGRGNCEKHCEGKN